MNAHRLLSWLLPSFCLVAGAGCNKTTAEPGPETVQVTYAQTQCADPWGLTQNNQQLRDAAVAYVQAKGATSFPLTISMTGQPVICAACTCPTGVQLTGTARRSDLPILEAIGFKKL